MPQGLRARNNFVFFLNAWNCCSVYHSKSKWNFKANFPLYFVLRKCYVLIKILGARYGDAQFLLQFAVYQPLRFTQRKDEIQCEWNDTAYKGESRICV